MTEYDQPTVTTYGTVEALTEVDIDDGYGMQR